jgi:hypothetical protein
MAASRQKRPFAEMLKSAREIVLVSHVRSACGFARLPCMDTPRRTSSHRPFCSGSPAHSCSDAFCHHRTTRPQRTTESSPRVASRRTGSSNEVDQVMHVMPVDYMRKVREQRIGGRKAAEQLDTRKSLPPCFRIAVSRHTGRNDCILEERAEPMVRHRGETLLCELVIRVRTGSM